MKQKLFTILTLLLCVCGGAWAQTTYYEPEADEVIILTNVYDNGASTANYSKHSGVLFYSNSASFANKTVGNPADNAATTISGNSLAAKNNGDSKRITLNFTSVSKLTVYHNNDSQGLIRILDLNNSSTVLASGSKGTTYSEFDLDGTKNYSIRLEGYGDKSSSDATQAQRDVYVYAVKLTKYGTSKTQSDLTITSATTLLLEKNGTSTITHTTSGTGAITYSSADEDVATVTDAGVITAVGGGKTKITVSQASDETYAAGSKVVDVNVPYDNPAAADTYTLTSPELSFSNAEQTKHYFTNGFTITTDAADGMQYAAIESNTGIKYSHVRTYTINTPSNVTATYLEIEARNNYATGGTAANWGTVLGTNYSSEELPYSNEEPQTKYFQIASPTAGADLSFSPGGNQWQGYITVHTNAWVAATSVGLDKTTTSIEVGETETLAATLSPANASNQNVTWTSSNDAVATVADGVVTAVAAGTATITVTTEDGSFTATCDVTVTPVVLPIVTLPTSSRTGYSSSVESSDINGTDYAMNGRKAYSLSNGGSMTLKVPSTTHISKIRIIGTSADNSTASTVTITGVTGESASSAMNLRKAASVTSFDFVPTTQTTTYTIASANKGSYIQISIYGTENSFSTKSGRNYATYVTNAKLDFANASGITAYIATGFNGAKDAIVLQSVDVVPANTPIIVKTDTQGATVVVDETDATATDVSSNALVPGNGTTGYDGYSGYDIYYLAGDLFHQATSGTLQKGKAYLKVEQEESGAPGLLRIVEGENNATSIQDIQTSGETIKFFEHGQLFILKNGITYDVLGRVIK